MSNPGQAMLLIGSPKGLKSTSFSLGSYLLEGLEGKGVKTKAATIDKLISTHNREDNLLAEINSADILILATPLYVDSLPAAVIKALELIKETRLSLRQPKNTLLLAIVNSGFPEAFHNNTALAMLRRFAKESDFQWAGGLALGGGGAIEGKSLKNAGGMVRNVIKSLDIAAASLAEGSGVPSEAIDLMAKPLMPSWMLPMLPFLGGFMWRQQAKKYGAQKMLHARPYDNAKKHKKIEKTNTRC